MIGRGVRTFGVLAAIVALVMVFWPTEEPAAVKAHNELVASRPAEMKVIKEHNDSADATAARGAANEEESKRVEAEAIALRARTDSIKAALAAAATVRDSLALALAALASSEAENAKLRQSLALERVAANNFAVSGGYRYLAFHVDSTRRERAEKVATDLRNVVSPARGLLGKIRERCGVQGGVGLRGPDVIVGCKIL